MTNNEYRTISMMEPEELDDDSRVQYVAAYLIEEFNRRGWIDECPRFLLNNAERKMLKKILKHPDGLFQFQDTTIESAIVWWVAGLKQMGYSCNIDIARSLNQFKVNG